MSMKAGIQIWAVKESFKENPQYTLRKMKDAGYNYMEWACHKADIDAGGFGIEAKELKKMLDDAGIQVVGAHVMPSKPEKIDGFYKDKDNLNRLIEFYQTIDCPSMSIPVDYFPTKEYLLERCDVYNQCGEYLAARGMKLLYHNHFFDFQKWDDQYVMDIIMENTDSAYLGIELDAYWMFRGALNPAEIIRKYGERISIIHIKDYPYDKLSEINAWKKFDINVPMSHEKYWSLLEYGYFTEIGNGMIKIQDIIDAGNENSVGYLIVEQDFSSTTEIESAEISAQNLRQMYSLEW